MDGSTGMARASNMDPALIGVRPVDETTRGPETTSPVGQRDIIVPNSVGGSTALVDLACLSWFCTPEGSCSFVLPNIDEEPSRPWLGGGMPCGMPILTFRIPIE
jgi:hypothetical protein